MKLVQPELANDLFRLTGIFFCIKNQTLFAAFQVSDKKTARFIFGNIKRRVKRYIFKFLKAVE